MKDRQHCILVNVSIYLIALAVYTLPVIILLLATGAAILVCVMQKQRSGRQESA